MSVGGYPSKLFVGNVSDELSCGICLDVLKDPHQCKNGHCFCLTCFSVSLKARESCPTCSMALCINTLCRNMLASNLIQSLTVSCSLLSTFNSEKCAWQGKLSELQHHYDVCSFRLVTCFLSQHGKCVNCPGLVSFKDLGAHFIPEPMNGTTNNMFKLFDNGMRFCGEFMDGYFTGIGQCYSANRQRFYFGMLQQNIMHGCGVIYYSDGSIYNGMFKRNLFHGNGVYTSLDGSVYDGQFLRGMKTGKGKCTYANGDIYEGYWLKNERVIHGKMTYVNGSVYTGQWSNNAINGMGVFRYANGDVYTGSLVNGLRHGYGHFSYSIKNSSGKTLLAAYMGQWFDDQMHGQGRSIVSINVNCIEYWQTPRTEDGTLQLRDGSHFTGEWVQGGKSRGIVTLDNGDVYDGEFVNDTLHGVGTMTMVIGIVHTGGWLNGEAHGVGTATYDNGSKYEGSWCGGTRHGQGTMTYSSGNTYIGQWSNSLPTCNSVMTYTNGDKYMGNYDKQMKRSGEGTLTTVDGVSYHGNWHKDMRHGMITITENRINGTYETVTLWVNDVRVIPAVKPQCTRYYRVFESELVFCVFTNIVCYLFTTFIECYL